MLAIVVAGLILILSILLAWLVGPLLGLAGTALLVLRILLVALGAIAAGIILFFHFREKHRDAATRNMPGGSDLDALLKDAENRLAAAQRGGVKSLDALPLLYILGDTNSAKTTAVVKSGFDPELLAGQVYREQDIVQTPVANFWYAQASAFVEAGGAVRNASALWNKLVRKTRPKAMRSAMGKEAPVRAAVVCVSSELFLGASAADAALASARSTNQQLRDLAQQLGTEVPVYVILTKLDRIPHFTEFVRNLDNNEVTQPMGMAFPRNAVSSGLYAEKAMGEVVAALDRIFFSLGEFRMNLLTRETDQRNVDPVYEFPRELRKLRNNLASYLVEIARPSHLNANPYLRGLYAIGVRAHIVEQMVASAAAQPQAQPAGSGATRMFSVEMMQAAAQTQAPQTVSRKQAQWCFLPKLFPEVILGDRSALAGTSNSSRTHIFRRVVFASVSALLLLFILCLTVSWIHNSRIEHDIVSAANALPTTATPPTVLASAEALGQLDRLRAAIVQLEDYNENGAPLMYRFGLYHGNRVLDAARRIYFDRFRNLMLANTQANLVASFNALPPTPAQGADYSATYNPLKAYLITTSNPEKSTVEFLPPVLMQYWENGRVPDTADQRDLATRQFEFYAGELPRSNPLPIPPDTLAVNRARTYLNSFGGIERIYQSMLTAANKVAPSIDFNRNYPGSSSTVVDSHVVAGAFTKPGYAFMQDALAHPDRYFSGEVWVLGNQAPASSLDRASLTQQLSTRYATDYAAEWRTYLHSAEVLKYSNLADAASKLQLISNPNSPLLALFFTVSQNTAIANPDISKEFQPAQALVAPDNPDKFVGQGNSNYMNGLIGLQAAVQQVASTPNPSMDPSVVAPIINASTGAHTAATQTAQAFNLDPQAHVDQTILSLMQDPIDSVDAVVRGRGAAAANGGGASFCAAYNQLTGKYPFNPNATVEANASDLTTLLQPGSGKLWQFYDGSLKQFLIQQGTTYAAAPEAPAKVNPDFVRFFNRMAGLSNGLYGAGSQGLPFTVHIMHSNGIQSVSFQLDAQTLSGSDVSKQFTWSPSTSQRAELAASYGSAMLPLLQFNGPWSVFHLLAKGRMVSGGATDKLDFPLETSNTPIVVNGTPLVVHLELSGPNASLMVPGGLSGMHCVSMVAH
ncbi:MAG: ImcF-related family protein [Terracidiphilus sp.]